MPAPENTVVPEKANSGPDWECLFWAQPCCLFSCIFPGSEQGVVGTVVCPALRGPDVTVCAISFQCCPLEFISPLNLFY